MRPIGQNGVGGAATPALLQMERGAMINFGIPSLGAHVNGFVADPETGRPTHMWIGRRAMAKPTYPGLLDQIAAGGCGRFLPNQADEKDTAPPPKPSR